MARVVGLDGVGHQFDGEKTLRAEWRELLKLWWREAARIDPAVAIWS
jgi:hypothetical protein